MVVAEKGSRVSKRNSLRMFISQTYVFGKTQLDRVIKGLWGRPDSMYVHERNRIEVPSSSQLVAGPGLVLRRLPQVVYVAK